MTSRLRSLFRFSKKKGEKKTAAAEASVKNYSESETDSLPKTKVTAIK